MKRLSWILTLPLMVVAVVFAVANRELVTLDLWPLAMTIQAPLFILVLGSTVVGLLAGAAVAWFSSGPTRRRAREARRRAAELEREVAHLREKLENTRPAVPPRPQGDTADRLPPVSPPSPVATGSGPRTIL
jgi:uncharacterized integral membrane protein